MTDYEAVLKQARTCANRKYCDLGGNCEYYDLDVCCQGGEKDILKDAADAIEELLAAVPKWISVRDVSDEEICAAKMVLSVIENLDKPMIMFDIEKSAVKKALLLMLKICEAEPPKEV